MTKSTDSRQLRLLVDGILEAHGIDNLKLSMDLCAAFKQFYASETPIHTREEIVARVRIALDKNAEQQNFDERIEAQFKRFPLNWIAFAESEKDRFRKFLKSEDGTLEKFVDWWTADEWRMSHPPANLGIIMQKWPQAFMNNKVVESPEDRQFRTIGI